MSATIKQIPLTPSLSKDDNFVKIETNEISVIYPYFRFSFNNNAAAVGDQMILSWLGNTVTMTCVAGIPDNSGNQFVELTGGLDIYEYSAIVAEAFRKNELIFDNWTVVALTSTGGGLLLKYKEPIEMTPSGSTDISGATTLATPGANPLLQENLEGTIKVIEVDPDTEEENNIISLSAPYDITTKQVSFNLTKLPTVQPHLPTASSIEATVPMVHHYESDHAHQAYRKVYVRYADKYGAPAISEVLKKSFEFYILYGGSPAHTLHQFQIGPGHKICHSHIWNNAQFYKPTGQTQPDWVYFFPTSLITNAWITAKISYDDGTQENYTVPTGVELTLDAYKLYWFSSGYIQMALDQAPGSLAGKTVVYYEFRISSADYNTIHAAIGYNVECICHPWEQYILFDNGLGGCESLRVTGKKESLYSVNRESFQTVRSDTFDAQDGELGYYAEKGTQGMEVNTGFYSRSYIEHLKQVLIGKTWLIDTVNARFIRILVSTSQVKPSADDNDLFSLSFTYRYATNDNAFHEK